MVISPEITWEIIYVPTWHQYIYFNQNRNADAKHLKIMHDVVITVDHYAWEYLRLFESGWPVQSDKNLAGPASLLCVSWQMWMNPDHSQESQPEVCHLTPEPWRVRSSWRGAGCSWSPAEKQRGTHPVGTEGRTVKKKKTEWEAIYIYCFSPQLFND